MVNCMGLVLMGVLHCTAAVGGLNLTEGFDNPPDSARPQTFWHWMNGNVTKEGITADLEAMKEAGIGGVFLFDIEGQVTESVPVYVEKPVRFLTPEWFAMLRHAATECRRLGLEFSLMNCTGWTTSGGPWVLPEQSMMRVAWSERYFEGPGPVTGPLPKPPCDYANYQNLTAARQYLHDPVPPEERFYRDMAVVAWRLEPLAARTAALWPPQMACSETAADVHAAVDGDGSTTVGIQANGFLQFDFSEPIVVRGVEYLGDACVLQVSDDNTTWRDVADLPGPRKWDYPQTLSVQETSARYFRLFYRAGGSVRDVKLSGDSFVQEYGPKASFHGVWEDIKTADERIGRPTPSWVSASLKGKEVLNLTERLRPDGTLDWEAPEGDWMILRVGCAPIGRLNGPCAREFAGLECDKLNAEAVEEHFKHYAGRVADELQELIGSGFHAVHVDSWEAGDLNATPQFIEEFRKRRGYDPMPFLPVYAGGRVVDSADVADRFLWDVRRTIGDLLADNYFGKLNELCHQRGLKFQGEIAGVMIQTTADQLQIKGRCDLPMGEFQMPNCVYGDHWARWDTREAASGAHIHDKPIAAAEAFTTFDRWMTDPYGLKGIGDLAYAMGINRLVFHTWAHHPWNDRAPGMTMGPFGVNFSRLNTWWGRPAKAYIDYLRRCQYLLQQGRYVADILYFYGEGAPNTLPSKSLLKPALPDGYSYDGCDADTLLSRVDVRDGRLLLQNGMSYRVLVLHEDERMTPEVLAKLQALVKAGATVVGAKPVASPSLKDYPQCDEQVRSIANELWGDVDGQTSVDRVYGAGRVIWGRSVAEVLKSSGIDADVEFTGCENGGPVEWIHRQTDDADIYFLSNQQNMIDHGASLEIYERRYDSFAVDEQQKDTVRIEAAFRVTGKHPELWNAVTGLRRDLPEYRAEHGRTVIPLALPPSGSCFIVFRRALTNTNGSSAAQNVPEYRTRMELAGPWQAAFAERWGGPGQVTFDTLADWTTRDEPGIRFYSGRATYRKVFDVAEETRSQDRLWLDLGTLRSLAEIRLNGKDLGVLWCPPWRVEVTGMLKPTGNELEIDIVNLWANRVIGDTALPKEQRLTWTSLWDTIGSPKPNQRLVPSGLYGPVTLCSRP